LVLAAWAVFEVEEDAGDFADTLRRILLATVKKDDDVLQDKEEMRYIYT
jgi:hypothetical protein